VDKLIRRNKQFMRDIFAGPFRGHGVLVAPPVTPNYEVGDFAASDRPVSEWLGWAVGNYEVMVENLRQTEDDSVPSVSLNTNTGIFAAAFGCPMHTFEDMETNACALPIVETPAEADALPEPDPFAPPLNRLFELGRLARRELGPEAPIRPGDIQSPFDIAALIWKKENMFLAMIENPDAVHRLVAKCHRLLEGYLKEFRREFPNCNFAHCPSIWAPNDLGAWLSEDEVGSISTEMFDEFCLPSLTALSETFGGLFMHCCATADHQYEGFKKIPNLRGLNRVFQEPGPRPAIEAFSGRTVLIQAWLGPNEVWEHLEMSLPDTRWVFCPNPLEGDDAKRFMDEFRRRCPRSD